MADHHDVSRPRAGPAAGAAVCFRSCRVSGKRAQGAGLCLELAADPARGSTWQDRWTASGAEHEADWRPLPQLAAGRNAASRNKTDECSTGLTLLISADVIRPSLDWLLMTPAPKNLAAAMARTRDPAAFAELAAICDASATSRKSRQVALARIAMIMAAKGGPVEAISVGDCIQMHQASVNACHRVGKGGEFRSPFFYQLLRSLGGFPEAAPPTTRAFNVRGQMSVEAMVDRYGIECRPVRDLLIDYLREFLVSSDYSTVTNLSYVLGKLFWRDLELHNPGKRKPRPSNWSSVRWQGCLVTHLQFPAGRTGRRRTCPPTRNCHSRFRPANF